MLNKKQKFKWFTLVEILVFLLIIFLLSIILYFIYNKYFWNVNNSKRLSDIKTIERSIEEKLVEKSVSPLPDNLVKINSEDVLIWYQWEIWNSVVSFLSLNWNFKDPVTWENYLYSTNSLKNKWQIATFMDEKSSSNIDNSLKIPTYTWSPLWLILQKDNSPIHKNSVIISEGGFNTLTWSLINEDVRVLFWKQNLLHKPFIIWGQLLQLSKWYSFEAPTNCPKNYIPVPWNIELGQPWFCVWKYEASYEYWKNTQLVTDYLEDVATNLWNSDPLCYKDWYWIMTLMQRLTIARNIENNPENWSWWKVWKWFIKTWNSWDTQTWFSYWKLLPSWPSWNSKLDELRTLKLSNWEVIWDFIWNAWEAVSPINLSNWENEILKYTKINFTWKYDNYLKEYLDETNPNSLVSFVDWETLNDVNYKAILWPLNNISNAWLWKYKYTTTWNIFLTGGDYTNWNAWLYSLYKYYQLKDSKFSTRCVYIK